MWPTVSIVCFVSTTLLSVVHVAHSSGVGKWDVFSTKTPYNWAHPEILVDPITDQGTNVIFKNETCNAVHISMIARHGARYPGSATSKHIAGIRDTFLKSKDAAKLLELNDWVNPYTEDMANELTTVGQNELYDFGQRTGKRFRALFEAGAHNVQFLSSNKPRTIDSSKFFYKGIKQEHTNFGAHNNQLDDKLLRFYDECENFDNDIANKPGYFREAIKFEESKDFAAVKEGIKTRLGLNFTFTTS